MVEPISKVRTRMVYRFHEYLDTIQLAENLLNDSWNWRNLMP